MLLRFDPFRELDRVAQQFERGVSGTSAMPMDAIRSDDEIRISFDLPGVEPENIDLTVEQDVLTVTATRSQQERTDGDEVLANERYKGTISRRILLGDTLDTDNLQASYDYGVLTVRIPLAERAKPRKVPIEASARRAAIETTASEA